MKSKMYVSVVSGMFKKYRNQYMKSVSKIGDMHPVLCMERTLDQEKQKKNIGVLEKNNMTAKEDDRKFAIAVTNFSSILHVMLKSN